MSGTSDGDASDVDRQRGFVPGDGIPVVWEEALGLNRSRYLTLTLRQCVSRRMAEGLQVGMAVEGLTAADLAHQG